jgi:tRNA threonylcarbamoyladenosine biosynthesis protein TsaB
LSYILSLETATRNCSVAIAKDGSTIFCKEIAELGYSHAEQLHLFIATVLQEANISFADLKAIAVSKGPGSYTGLRIGVSTAKGLCYALGIPLVSIDTLSVLIIPMIDARRMEVYTAAFKANKEIIKEVQAEILNEESFSFYNETIHFVGDSNEKAKTVLTQPNFIFHDTIIFPSAKAMSFLAHQKFITNDFEDIAYFEPFYLKDFILKTKQSI